MLIVFKGSILKSYDLLIDKNLRIVKISNKQLHYISILEVTKPAQTPQLLMFCFQILKH